jgi:hypothetical protein
MQRQKIGQFLRSFVLLPVAAATLSTGSIATPTTPPTVPLIQQNIVAPDPATIKKALQAEEAQKIDAYFHDRKMPLEGYGPKMVAEAEKNGLDWRVLPAIAVRESTGGIHACKRVAHNFFGWGGCTIGFKSADEAIETVARNLGGNNPKTASYYDGDLKDVLETYNGLAVASYANDVMGIMDKMATYQVNS